MLTVIGLILWVLITIMITITPFLIAKIRELGGGLDYKMILFCIVILFLASFSWANIFSVVDIAIKAR